MTKSDVSYASVPTAVVVEAEAVVPDDEITTAAASHVAPSAPPAEQVNDPYAEELQMDSWHRLKRCPVELPVCPMCHNPHVRTRTRTYPNAVTWILVGVGFFLWTPLCWVPLVLDSCKQSDQYCQSCGNKLWTVQAFEGFCVREQN